MCPSYFKFIQKMAVFRMKIMNGYLYKCFYIGMLSKCQFILKKILVNP